MIGLSHIAYSSQDAPEAYEKMLPKVLGQALNPGCKATISCYKCCVGDFKDKGTIEKICKEEYKNWRNAQNNKPCGCPEE